MENVTIFMLPEKSNNNETFILYADYIITLHCISCVLYCLLYRFFFLHLDHYHNHRKNNHGSIQKNNKDATE